MGIKVTCHCGEILAVNENLAGKRVRCATCSQVLNVPEIARCECGKRFTMPRDSAAAGKALKCPHCGNRLKVRTPDVQTQPSIADLLDEVDKERERASSQIESPSAELKRPVSKEVSRHLTRARSRRGNSGSSSVAMPTGFHYYAMIGLGFFLLLPFLTARMTPFFSPISFSIAIGVFVLGLVGRVFWC